MKPMEMTRIGTVQDPIPIYSLVSHQSKSEQHDDRVRGDGTSLW
jgi:hypothetical protein